MRLSTRAPGAALLLLAVLAAGCSKQKPERKRPPVPVSVARAHRADVPYTIDANGVVMPMRTSAVTSQVEGIVRRVAFTEGQDVVQGQVLFEIDDRPYRAAYQQALATLARDKANAANAEREAARYEALVKQDYVTREQADQSRATAAALQATVQADEASVANAKFNLDNTVIRAPIGGRTGSLLVREGNVVHANGSSPLVVINQVSPILVRFAVPATQLPLIRRYASNGGLPVTARPSSPGATNSDTAAGGAAGLAPAGDPTADPAGAPGDDAGGAPTADLPTSSPLFTGRLEEQGQLYFIDNAVDTTTGTVQLKAQFQNGGKNLWVGEYVATSLRLFVQPRALVIPSQAVVTGQQGTYVFVVDDSGKARQRRVSVERTAGNLAVIASGVHDGEQVVTEGQARVTPGATVAIAGERGGAGRGGGAHRGPGGRGGGRRAPAGAPGT